MISSRGVRRDNWCISSSCSAKGAFQKEGFQTSFWTWKTSLAYDFEYPSSDEKICLGKPWWRIGDFSLSMDGGTYGLAICLAAYFRLAVLLHRWSGEVKSFIQCWTHLNPPHNKTIQNQPVRNTRSSKNFSHPSWFPSFPIMFSNRSGPNLFYFSTGPPLV